MGEQHTIPTHGSFCWNELGTKDAEAAKKFYAELLGWQLKECDADDAPSVYTEIVVGDKQVGGIYKMGQECGDAPSQWMPYIAVDDVDDSVRRVWELGGKVCVPPTDIPNVGRFSVVSDPTGATISLITMSGAHN
ncbi:MAG: VOC family protein [Acidobacteria bacterium]|nr:VOC family protein [Acidobacteriota bacterium]